MEKLNPTPGSIVTCRRRQWVVLPSELEDIIRLRPLSGNEDEIAGIYRELGLEAIESATFPLPKGEQVQDHRAALLLMDAARLLLRSGAGPLLGTFITASPSLSSSSSIDGTETRDSAAANCGRCGDW